MKSKTLIIVAINIGILVLLAILLPQMMIAPGATIDAHSEIANDCFACHTPFIGSTPNKCTACHKVSEIGIRTTKGLLIPKEKKNVAFHQELIEEDCVACHSDHKGVQAFRPIDQFSHELLQSGTREQCGACHANPDDSLHRKIKGNCGQCHTQDAWLPAVLNHDEYFRFDRHHDAECEVCHIGGNYSDYTCYGCHEHSRSKIRGEHVEEGIYDYENCVKCHRSGDEHEAERIWRASRYERDSSSYESDRYRERRSSHHEDDDDDD